eukprot:SM007916S22526  [mRNA]  locus=s7916:317:555:- [translate_table: standard]
MPTSTLRSASSTRLSSQCLSWRAYTQCCSTIARSSERAWPQTTDDRMRP